MSYLRLAEGASGNPVSSPTLHVLVYRNDTLLLSEWCDSEDDALDAVRHWGELPGVRCVVEIT